MRAALVGHDDAFIAPGQPAQAEQDQGHGHHLDGQLGQRQIRGREPHESQADHQPRPARKRQRRKAVILGFPGNCQRAEPANPPEQGKSRMDGRQRLRPPGKSVRPGQNQATAERDDKDQQQLFLQARRGQLVQQTL